MTIVTRRPAVAFVLLAFGLTWAAWIPMLLQPDRFASLHFLGSLGPAAAAIIITAATTGRIGIRALGAAAVRWNGRWLAFAIALPATLFAVGLLASLAAGSHPDLDRLLESPEYGYLGPGLIALEIAFFGFGEELGWRGFLIPHLESAARTPYAATTIFIAVWATWHVPLFFYANGLGSMSPLMIPGWLISIALSSYLITWLFHRSGNSVLVIAVFHGVVDLFSITPASTVLALIALNAGLIAVAIVVITRSRVLFASCATNQRPERSHPRRGLWEPSSWSSRLR
jgi:membrane protease YdiL (CAAX protease family)